MNNFILNNKQQDQLNYYNNLASFFDKKFNRENINHLYKIERISKYFFKYFKKYQKQKFDFIEIGGGTGIHAFHFINKNKDKINKFVFSDISNEMINLAKKRLNNLIKNIEFILMPAEKFNTKLYFDGVYISGSMHHFSNPREALIEIRKHLNSDGIIVICEPIVTNPINFIKAMIKKEEWGQFKVTRKNINFLLKKTNFKVVENKVIHYKSSSKIISRLFPYKTFERIKLLDSFAVMFLIVAKPI